MADSARLICAATDLTERGDGVRFDVSIGGVARSAFVVRYHGAVRGYLNQCAHVPIELDWLPGKFFDTTGLYLICSVHGAHYLPESGYCAMGPCKGRSLRRLDVFEREGQVFVRES